MEISVSKIIKRLNSLKFLSGETLDVINQAQIVNKKYNYKLVIEHKSTMCTAYNKYPLLDVYVYNNGKIEKLDDNSYSNKNYEETTKDLEPIKTLYNHYLTEYEFNEI